MGRRDRFYLQGGGHGFGEEVCLPGEAPEQRGGSRAVGGSPAGWWRGLWGGPGWKGLTLGAFQGEGEQQRSLPRQRQRGDRNREGSLGVLALSRTGGSPEPLLGQCQAGEGRRGRSPWWCQ